MDAYRLRIVVVAIFAALVTAAAYGLVVPGVGGGGSTRSPGYDAHATGANASAAAATPLESVRFDGDRAMRDVEAQMGFGPRPTGSAASLQTASYIADQLVAARWKVETQDFEYQATRAQNIIGRGFGSGDSVFIIGAHYDTRRRADQDRSSPDAPVPGANDGASGVAVLLELARVLDLTRVQGQVWLVFFDAEDNGHLDEWDWIAGSRYFVGQLQMKPDYAIVVNMVGDREQAIYLDGNSDPGLRDCLWQTAAQMGYGEYFVPQIRYSMLDDHTPFMQSGVPAVDTIDFDYPFWHTTQDTTDKVSSLSLERVGRVLESFLEAGGKYPHPLAP